MVSKESETSEPPFGPAPSHAGSGHVHQHPGTPGNPPPQPAAPGTQLPAPPAACHPAMQKASPAPNNPSSPAQTMKSLRCCNENFQDLVILGVGVALEEQKMWLSFERKKRFCTIPTQTSGIRFTVFLWEVQAWRKLPRPVLRDGQNHTAAAPWDGRSPNIWGKDETRDEGSMNSSDAVWVFQLRCEKPLALNSSDLSYFLKTDISAVRTR